MIDASWVIENRETGKPVLETYNFELIQFINIKKYRVWTIAEWLYEVNRRIKEGKI
jgi:hypothetical protein